MDDFVSCIEKRNGRFPVAQASACVVFDLRQARVKRTQAEACATETLHSQSRNAGQSTEFRKKMNPC
jgi:hypothetical protein